MSDDKLEHLIDRLPDREAARRLLPRLEAEQPALFASVRAKPAVLANLMTLAAYSPWLGDVLLAQPEIVEWLARQRNLDRTYTKETFLEELGRYAARINGVDTVAITKLDVLDTVATIKICTGYRLHEAVLDYPPSNVATLSRVEPIYEEMPGWQQPTTGVRRFDQLPNEARDYIARLCELVGARIGMVSVGPGREQIVEVSSLF